MMFSPALPLLWMHGVWCGDEAFPLLWVQLVAHREDGQRQKGGWEQPQDTYLECVLPFGDGARDGLRRGTWVGEPKGLGENTELFFSPKPLEIAKQGEIVQNILQKDPCP